MNMVRAKKHLGQHFLKDQEIAREISKTLQSFSEYNKVLEIGPGTGMLTSFLLENKRFETWCIEVDQESIDYLTIHFPSLRGRILNADFLQFDIASHFGEPVAIIGNFPYNISSQILFRVLDQRDLVPECAGMFQKEVAKRIASGPGSKEYGILSVLLQVYYDIEYLFTVPPNVFHPPPKVDSGVIHLKRKEMVTLPCEEKHFKQVVKTAFNQRRKTLRNSLKVLASGFSSETQKYLSLRPEQLGYQEFLDLTASIHFEK